MGLLIVKCTLAGLFVIYAVHETKNWGKSSYNEPIFNFLDCQNLLEWLNVILLNTLQLYKLDWPVEELYYNKCNIEEIFPIMWKYI